jgi:iron complex outermembrane recepter protein
VTIDRFARTHWAVSLMLCCATGHPGTSLAAAATPDPQGVENAANEVAGNDQLSDIIVTAQKRSQSLQDVPISVTALGEMAMQRADIHLTSDLPSVAPALTYSSGFMPGVSSFNIRGLGTYVYRIGVEPAISVVRDGIPLARPADFVAELGDVDSAEILNGPQGTLFGRNATAGVISITRQAPTDSFGGYFDGKALYGNALGDVEGDAKGAVNLPINDEIKARVAGFWSNNSNYIKNYAPDGASDIGGRHAFGLTEKVAVEFSEASRLMLTFDEARIHQANGSPEIFVPLQAYQLPTVPNIAAKQTALFGAALGQQFAADDYYPFFQFQDLWSADVDYSLTISPYLRLRSLTGYHTDKVESQANFYPGPATPEDPLGFDLVGVRTSTFNPNEYDRQTTWDFLSNEDRLEYSSRWFDAVGGFFYSNISEHEQIDLGRLRSAEALGKVAVVGTPAGPSADYPYFYQNSYTHTWDSNKAVAGFVDVTAHPTDVVSLFTGYRISQDSLHFDYFGGNYSNIPVQLGVNFDPTTNSPTVPFSSTLAFAGSHVATNSAYRAGMTWKISPDVIFYASYNHSYIGAGVDLSAATAGRPSNPDAALLRPSESNSYEAGIKNELWGKKLRLNLAVFDAKTKDAQVSALVAGTSTSRVQNAGNIEAYGSELSVDVIPIEPLTLNAGVAYLHSKFTDLTMPCYPGQTAALGCNVPVGPVFVERIDGEPSLDAPRWKSTLSGTYNFLMPNLPFDMYLRADYHYQTKVYYQLDHDPFATQGTYGILNLGVGFTDHAKKYEVRVFSDNVTNRYYCPNEVNGPLARQECQSSPIDAQRRYGIDASVKF